MERIGTVLKIMIKQGYLLSDTTKLWGKSKRKPGVASLKERGKH